MGTSLLSRAVVLAVVAAGLVPTACTLVLGIEDLHDRPPPDAGSPGTVGIAPSSLSFGGVSCGSGAKAQTITISNTTHGSVTWEAKLADPSDQQFAVAPSSGTIAAGEQASIVVTPAPIPADAGSHTYQDQLIVTTSALDAGERVSLVEGAEGSILIVSPSSLDFGRVAIGAIADASVVVTNEGDLAASVALSGGSGFVFSPATVDVPPDASVTVGVSFSPAAFGDAGASVTIAAQSSCASAQTLALGGQGFGVGSKLAASRHTCAILSSGALACWGANDFGQLGQGTSGAPIPTPVLVAGLPAGRKVLDVATGYGFTCAVIDTGAVYCWGENDVGECGNGASLDAGSPNLVSPTQVVGITDATAIASGSDHTCVLRGGGDAGTAASIACWGADGLGQLGDGAANSNATPGPVVAGPSGPFTAAPVRIAAGNNATCAVLADATAWCWGDQKNGTFGASLSAKNVVRNPTPIETLPSFGTIALSKTACAVQPGGTDLYCWGDETNGEVGDGEILDAGGIGDAALVLPNVSQASVGQAHMCALAFGKVSCWGSNASGQLGLGASAPLGDFPTPQIVTSVFTAAEVVVGSAHTCARLPSGSVSCWGGNGAGAVGNGDVGDGGIVPSPTPVVGF